MSQLVDMSLDDIIKSKKKQRGENKPRFQRLQSLGARSGITARKLQRNIQTKQEFRLHVSNLDYQVTNQDIKQLFSEIGPIKKAAVHYDKSGRSLGTAEVAFTTREAAIRAIKRYNQVPLDGRLMIITLVPSSTTQASPSKSRLGIQKTRSTNTKSPRNKGGRSAGGRSGPAKPKRRQPRKQVTAEELDADLEDYASKSKPQG